MKKKLLSVMLVIAMVLSMVPTAFAAEVDDAKVDALKAKVEEYYNWAVADPEAAYDKAVDLAEWVEDHPEEAYANVAEAYEKAYAELADVVVPDIMNAIAELDAKLAEMMESEEVQSIAPEYLEELAKEVEAVQNILTDLSAAIEKDKLATLDGVRDVAWSQVDNVCVCLGHIVHILNLAAEDAEQYANAEIIPELKRIAAEIEDKWENEWKPTLETAVEELVAAAADIAKEALAEAYDALVEAAAAAAEQYGPEIADAIYNYLYDHPAEVIDFVKTYSGDVVDFIVDNQEAILAVLGYLAATYGEDVVNYVLENDQEILETMVEWYAVHGDNFEALVLVYLEELGVIDAAEDLYAQIEEMLGEATEDIEAAIQEIIAEVEAAIAQLEKAADELKAQLEDLKAQLEDAADEAKAEIEKAIAEIEKAIEEIEATIAELQAKVEELMEIAENIYAATSDVIDAILMAGEDIEAAVEALQKALTDLAEAIGAAEDFIAEMNDAIAEAVEWASDVIEALGELAEEIVAGAIEVMETVEEIVGQIQDAIEEAAAELMEAYEAFLEALYNATHETVYSCAIDTYVALGGEAVAAEDGYVDAVAAYIGDADVIKLSELNALEDAAAYIEANAETIAAADFITYQMEATALINNLLGEADWTAYLSDEAIAFAEEVEDALMAELAKELDAETLESTAPMAEKVAYCAVSYAVETVKALETINAINPEAPVLVIGMYNPLAGMTATVDGEEIAIGDMVEYAMKATDLYYVIYAVVSGNVDFVHACGTDINGYDEALDVDAIAADIALLMSGDISKYEEMMAAVNRVTALVEELMNSMLTSEQGQADLFEAVQDVLTVEDHKWNDGVVTAATCTEAGYTTYTCELCGATKTEAGDAAKGHTWGAWASKDKTNHTHACSVCDATEDEAHKMVDGVCSVCGYKETTSGGGSSSGSGSSRSWHCPTCKSDVCHSKAYADLDLDAWYHEYTDYVLCKGMMVGMSDTIFAPETETTRAMLTTILYRIAGSPAVSGEMPFADVAEGQWYTDAILWAAENDIVLGYGDGNFGPMDSITREQIAALFFRFAELKGMNTNKSVELSPAYDDASDIGAWAVDYMEWAVATGLMKGRSTHMLAPAAGTTRAEAAALLERWCEEIAD